MLAAEPREQRVITQHALKTWPGITYGQFRHVAKQQAWTIAWLIERVSGELDKPTETLRRVMYRALVNGRHELLPDIVIPYRCLIDLYQQATQPTPAQAGEKACACGCGSLLRGRQKWATPGCRKRVQRRAGIAQKVAV